MKRNYKAFIFPHTIFPWWCICHLQDQIDRTSMCDQSLSKYPSYSFCNWKFAWTDWNLHGIRFLFSPRKTVSNVLHFILNGWPDKREVCFKNRFSQKSNSKIAKIFIWNIWTKNLKLPMKYRFREGVFSFRPLRTLEE